MHRPIIKNGQIVADLWQRVDETSWGHANPEHPWLATLPVWLTQQAHWPQPTEKTGVWLEPDDELDDIVPHLQRVALIAIHFPVFTDGRGYSLARLLRERYDYHGEIRAVGDVWQDQLFYLARSGFNAFDIKQGKSVEDALRGLTDFSVCYQAAADEPRPLYARR